MEGWGDEDLAYSRRHGELSEVIAQSCELRHASQSLHGLQALELLHRALHRESVGGVHGARQKHRGLLQVQQQDLRQFVDPV